MMSLAHARRLAADVAGWLAPGCAEIAVVGSIRREVAECHDVELAILPAAQPDLFGDWFARLDLLDAALAPVLADKRLIWHPENPARGKRLKRLWCPAEAIAVELWIADGPDNWGDTLAIRTGDQSFSQWLVTHRQNGGAAPRDLFHSDGYWWRIPVNARGLHEGPPQRLASPDEAAFFRWVGIDEVPSPPTRTVELARTLAAQLAEVGHA